MRRRVALENTNPGIAQQVLEIMRRGHVICVRAANLRDEDNLVNQLSRQDVIDRLPQFMQESRTLRTLPQGSNHECSV
jgi:hypothetical protein